MNTYRKTKTGEWVAYGTYETLRIAVGTGPVAVHRRDGQVKMETITRLGRPFTADGVEMVYGYFA